MVDTQERPSEGPAWYLQQDVQVALLWHQLNAVCAQLAQTNQQLYLQQNLILGLQQQRLEDQKLISNLVGKLMEPECCKAKMPAEACAAEEPLSHKDCSDTSTDTRSPGSDSAERPDAEWILVVFDASEETVATEGAGSPVSEDTVAPSTPAAMWLGPDLSICPQRSDSCDVPESVAAECQEAPSKEPPRKIRISEGFDSDPQGGRGDESPASASDAQDEGAQRPRGDVQALAERIQPLGIEGRRSSETVTWSALGNDLLSWRLVSRRTRSPEALTAHLAEMGSMDGPAAILAFAEQLELFGVNPNVSNESAFEGDAEQQKLCECRLWCLALASKTFTHFSESYVRRAVGKNLQYVLRHCWSADSSTAAAAHLIAHNHASDALPFVAQMIADGMLARMEELVRSNIRANLKHVDSCARILEKILRSLSKPQCQKWVSLTVKLLMGPHVTDKDKERLVWQLKMLWLVDDDPKRTYAEAEQQLVAVCDFGEFNNDLLSLLNSS
ncbi:unnamed protein product [Symbiodinium sp. CCMP2456]|nr:unnamed protein product [Symbiodinium sp. CCMP2456]